MDGDGHTSERKYSEDVIPSVGSSSILNSEDLSSNGSLHMNLHRKLEFHDEEGCHVLNRFQSIKNTKKLENPDGYSTSSSSIGYDEYFSGTRPKKKSVAELVQVISRYSDPGGNEEMIINEIHAISMDHIPDVNEAMDDDFSEEEAEYADNGVFKVQEDEVEIPTSNARVRELELENIKLQRRLKNFEACEKKCNDLESLSKDLSKSLNMWQHRAQIVKAVYEQLLQALNDEGIDIQVSQHGSKTWKDTFAEADLQNFLGDSFSLFDSPVDAHVRHATSECTDDSSVTDALNAAKEDVEEDRIATELIAQNLKSNQEHLPALSGFLFKKSPALLRGWQKRFFFVKHFKLYYSKDLLDFENMESKQLADKKILSVLSLITIQSIVPVNDPKFHVLQVIARDPKFGELRIYVLRASSRDDRDRWVRDLNLHRDHLLSTLRWASS